MDRSTLETYRTTANASLAEALGVAPPFAIDVRFLGGLTPRQMDAFKTAADRWVKVIVGDLPDAIVDGEIIDDVLILAQGARIDGPGSILGQAGPTDLRPESARSAALLPAKGKMIFDIADLERMEAAGTLIDVITHEMGHVLGCGTIWNRKGLTREDGPTNPVFIGENAMREYGLLRDNGPMPVPLENTGGPGTRGSHWRETVFGTELMTGLNDPPPNANSRVTVASLQDCGYTVDMSAADPYTLPDLLALAETGVLASRVEELNQEVMLPIIPIELSEESLR